MSADKFVNISDDDEEFGLCNEDDEDENEFDEAQNIARSSFGDMVNDLERNQLFEKAIEKTIKKFKANRLGSERDIYVLDVGCGTGLLSMMAARAGATEVVACDRFNATAECAKKIIKRNGFEDKISVHACDSSKLDGSEFTDKRHKPDMIVAELLDTELIGEGCLHTYMDLNQRLAGRSTQFVPSRARVHVQLVQSTKLFAFHQFNQAFDLSNLHPACIIKTPKKALNCYGSHMLHDMQINRLEPGVDFEILSEPQTLFTFRFNEARRLSMSNAVSHRFKLISRFTKPVMMFVWWDVDMDYEGEVKLDCGPYWARGYLHDREIAWREHWMQAIYYLPAFAFNEKHLEGFDHDCINDKRSMVINAFHDPFSFWFDLPTNQKEEIDKLARLKFYETWTCVCGMHTNISRNRLAALNNISTLENYVEHFQTFISSREKVQCLFLGDQSILPFSLAHLSKVKQVVIVVESTSRDQFFQHFLEANEQLRSKMKIIKVDDLVKQPSSADVIVSDMHFTDWKAPLPAFNYFDWLRRCRPVLGENLQAFPDQLALRCCLVEFRDYWKCFAKVGNDVQGFDLTDYDQMIEDARSKADHKLEPLNCWEYFTTSRSKAYDLWNVDLVQPETEDLEKIVEIDVTHLEDNLTHPHEDRWSEKIAIVLWLEQKSLNQVVNNLGPILFDFANENREQKWTRDAGQLISFLGDAWPSRVVKTNQCSLLKFCFQLNIGEHCKKLDYTL